MLAGPSLSLVEGATAPSADLSVPEVESALADVRAAYSEWQSADDRAKRYRSILVECVLDARRGGEKLGDIAAAMGVTRQMVQKIIREAERGELEEAAAGAWLETQARKDAETHMRGLGFTARDRQCPTCHRFKARPSDPCDYCGNDPVGNIALGGSEWAHERREYDAAYGGGIR